MRNHFVVLQHGSHGRRSDLGTIKAVLHKALVEGSATVSMSPHPPSAAPGSVHIWESDVIELLKSDLGTVMCTEMVAAVLLPDLRAWAASLPGEAQCLLHVVGHSFGGIVLRDLIATIARDESLRPRLRFDSFTTIASPHLGVDDMNPVMKVFGRLIGRAYSETYKDLFLMNAVLEDRLLSDEHLRVLGDFRRRVLYANTRDHLVSFDSASLTVGCRDDVVASARPVDPVLFPHVLAPFDPQERLFANPTQGERILAMQTKLLGVGDWTVFPVHIPHWWAIPHNDVVAKFSSKFIDAPTHIAHTVAESVLTA
jgi:pimeloyl-ACP methyl ester carboxylesterase